MSRVRIEIEASFQEDIGDQFLLDRIADAIPSASSLKMKINDVDWVDPLEDTDDQTKMEISEGRPDMQM